MTTLLKNFVTITQHPRDLLSPQQYRSIIDMIESVTSTDAFQRFTHAWTLFQNHLTDYNDPHLERYNGFWTEVVAKVYDRYVRMLATPVTLDVFTNQIANSVDFLELFRRISLNRYLYNQVKNPDGSVTAGAHPVHLSPDWKLSQKYPNPVTVTFGAGIVDENSFLASAWGSNAPSLPVIFTATNLVTSGYDEKLIFSSTSACPTTHAITGVPGHEYSALDVSSNDLVLQLRYAGTPTNPTDLISLTNDTDTFTVTLNANQSSSVSLNGVILCSVNSVSADGTLVVRIDSRGFVTLTVPSETNPVTSVSDFVLTNDRPMIMLTTLIPYISLSAPVFGLWSVNVSVRSEADLPVRDFTVPAGYALIVDEDGSYFTDDDGAPLICEL